MKNQKKTNAFITANRTKLLIFVFAAPCFCLCGTASAQLQVASFYESAEGLDQYGNFLNGVPILSAPGTLTETDGSGDTEQDTITQGINPYVYSTATDKGGVPEALAAANFTYYFEIFESQPGGPATVPIWVEADFQATAGSFGFPPPVPFPNAEASLTVNLPDGTGEVALGSCISPGPYNAMNQEVNVNVNTLYAVRLSTLVRCYTSQVGQTSGGAASIDPEISIDPTFAAANPSVSIAFSPNFLGPVLPVLSSPRFSGGQFQMTVTNLLNQTYTVQMTTNLLSGSWVSLLATNPPSGSFVFTDPNATNQQGFYRVIEQ